MAACRTNSAPDPLPLAVVQAARVLRAGGVVLHATEGVWGVAADALNPQAILRLLGAKRRAVAKGLIVIGASADEFLPEIESLPGDVQAEVRASWPGAVSWIVPNQRFSTLVSGGRETVALRVPGHAQARALCYAFGGLLVSTSANLSGQPAPRSELVARRAMGSRVDFVVPGRTAGRKGPSEVRTWTGNIIRPSV